MVRKTSILCILVAFAISTLAQDTSTTDDTAALGSTTPTSSVAPVSDLATTAGDDNTTPLSNSEPVGDPAPAPAPTSENSSGTSGSDLTTSAGDDGTPSSSESVVNPTPATTTTPAPAPEDNTVQDADEPDNSSEPQNNGQASSNGTGDSSGTAVSASGYPDQDDGQVITASTPFPQSVLTEMGSRQMRYHHFLWHQVREGWNRFTPDVQQRYIDLGWKPPSPARNYLPNGTVTAIPDNGSGQDFLYMHRDMMTKVKDILARNNETYTITSWKTFPAPGDADWPVPPKYTIPPDNITEDSTNRSKEDSFYSTLQYYEKQFKDPTNLRNMTLDELGSQIEVTVHAWLHMRWSANCSVGFRRIYLNKTNLMYIDPIFDGPGNDWLVDTYSSHINPAFYKLHGWIDDRVEDWRIANNLTAIVWNGTWTGGPWETLAPILSAKQSAQLRGSAMNHQMPSVSGNTDVLEEVFKVFAESGVPETSVADDVKPGIPLWEYEP